MLSRQHRLRDVDFGILRRRTFKRRDCPTDAKYALPIVEVKREPLHLVFYRGKGVKRVQFMGVGCGEFAAGLGHAGNVGLFSAKHTAEASSEGMFWLEAWQDAGTVQSVWRDVEAVEKASRSVAA
jgi:hypothetical protein